jgi:hypothetical protein
MSTPFNHAAFLADLNAVRVARGLKWYSVFRQTGLSGVRNATKRAHGFGQASYATLATWAALDIATYQSEAMR